MNAVTDIKPPKAFRHLRSEGSPKDVGRAHGRAFGDEVLGSIAVYRKKFDEIRLDWSDVLEVCERSRAHLQAIDPLLDQEMEGIAEGAQVDIREIVAINIRTGLIRMVEEKPSADDHECTTFSVVPPASADGHTYIGQNWDQNGACQPNTVLIEQRIEGQPALLFITEAGVLFRHGMNDAGVGMVGNALRTGSEQRADSGLSGHFTRRRALRCTNMKDAYAALTSLPQTHSGNHMLASAESGEAVDVETVPGKRFPLYPESGILVHSNHLLHPEAVATVEDHGPEAHPDTLVRDCRLRDALVEKSGSITADDIKTGLQDHHGFPNSVCRHPDPKSDTIGYTLVSSIMDLTDKRMWTAPGPACVGTFTEYAFS